MAENLQLITSFIVLLIILVRWGPRSRVYKFLNQRFSYVSFLKKRHKYKEVANYYRIAAKFKRKKNLRANLLGIASLYEHDPDTAIKYFNQSLSGAIGRNSLLISNNMAVAYLQKGLFKEALKKLNNQREKGYVFILPYVLALLANGQDKEALEFKNQHPVKKDNENAAVEILLSFSSQEPNTLDNVRKLLTDNRFWLYQPFLRYLIEKWELEVYFARSDRYEILSAQARSLLSQFEGQPELFTNPEVRYVRSLISLVMPKVASYEGCAGLYGLIQNLDDYVLQLPCNEEFLNQIKLFWKRVYYVFSRTYSYQTYDKQVLHELIKAQIPPGAEPIVKCSSHCQIYLSQTFNVALLTIEVNEQGLIYTELLPKSLALEIFEEIKPVMEIMSFEPSSNDVLEPLLFDLVCNRDTITHLTITNVLNRIPPIDHSKLEPLKKRSVH